MGDNDWIPDEDKLSYVYQLLEDSQNPHKTHDAYEELTTMCSTPEFAQYLVYVFAVFDADGPIKASAGLIIKNKILSATDGLTDDVQAYLMSHILNALQSDFALVRTTASIVIAAVATQANETAFDLMAALVPMIDAETNYNASHGALLALKHIATDCHAFFIAPAGKKAVSDMLEVTLPLMLHSDPDFRELALDIANEFIVSPCLSLMSVLDTFLQHLCTLSEHETRPSIVNLVCEAFVDLFQTRVEHVLVVSRNNPDMANIIDIIMDYMVACTSHEDTLVAQQACQFWIAAASYTELDLLQDRLDTVIPLLLDRMMYSEEDIAGMASELRDNADEADEDKDIRPHFHKTKLHAAHERSSHESALDGPAEEEGEDDDDDSDGDWDSDDEDEDDPFLATTSDNASSNLRKNCGAALDLIANKYKEGILSIVIPLIEGLLQMNEWARVESGILGLGAIAQGCIGGLSEYLPSLVPYLTTHMSHDHPLIRAISCWAVCRYSEWLVHIYGDEELIAEVISGLLKCINDRNKKVQSMACSAIITMETMAGDMLTPLLPEIVSGLVSAYGMYQRKNLATLYDAIGTLADHVGDSLASEELVGVLMPPLTERYLELSDDNTEVLALFECLGSVLLAIGGHFMPYAEEMVSRSINMAKNTLTQLDLAKEDPGVDFPVPDFCVVPLDFLSTIAEALPEQASSLLEGTETVDLMMDALQRENSEIRQSAFALLGDLTRAAFHMVEEHSQALLHIISSNMNPFEISVTNNAIWSLGELAMKLGDGAGEFVEHFGIASALVSLMRRKNTAKGILENTAIAIGRLGYFFPGLFGPDLPSILPYWSLSMRNSADNQDKQDAFTGMCLLVQSYPREALPGFVYFCDAMLSWVETPQELYESFHQLLHSFKEMAADSWDQYFGKFPPSIREGLQEQFSV